MRGDITQEFSADAPRRPALPDAQPAAGGLVRKPSLAVLIIISGLGPLALNIFVPSMPGMQRVFDVDYATVQLTLTFYLAAMAGSQLLMGPLSDRFGRRPALLAGLALFVLGSGLALAAQSIGALILARMLQGAGGSAGLVLGRAIIRDIYDRGRSASMIGYVTMAMVVAPMIAPGLGGVLDEAFGWRASFVLLVVLGLVVLAIVAITLPETRVAGVMSGKGGLRSAGAALVLLRYPAFLGYALCMACTSAMFFAFLAGAPYIMVEIMGRSPGEYGLYFVIGAFGYMAGNFMSGRYSERFGSQAMMLAGTVFALVGMGIMLALALAGVLTPLALFGPTILTAIANGLVLPNATASAVSIRPDLAGSAAGLSGALQLTMGALATVLIGNIQDDTQFPMVWTMAAAAVLAFIGWALGRWAEVGRSED